MAAPPLRRCSTSWRATRMPAPNVCSTARAPNSGRRIMEAREQASMARSPGPSLGNLGPRRRWRWSIGLESEERCHELHTGNAVHQGVVQLRHDAQVVLLEPLDHVHLPQGVAPVELAPGEVRDEGGQLHLCDWCGQPHRLDVTVEVDSGIIDPPGNVETQWDLDQASPQRRYQVDPFSDIVPYSRDAVSAWHGGGIKDHHRHAMGEVVGRPLGS